jgi:hypothetical protein
LFVSSFLILVKEKKKKSEGLALDIAKRIENKLCFENYIFLREIEYRRERERERGDLGEAVNSFWLC